VLLLSAGSHAGVPAGRALTSIDAALHGLGGNSRDFLRFGPVPLPKDYLNGT
jgi:hypothetical protein